MNTLGGKTQRTIKKEESYSINEGFVCTEKASAGTMVKLNSDGTVSPVASVDDVPFGTLSCGCNAANGDVTVHTQFVSVVRGKADGAVAIGDDLAVSGSVTEDGNVLSKYKKAVAGNTMVAVALSGGADTTDVWVGVKRVFVTK